MRVDELLGGLSVPVVQAPMAGAATPAMAIEVIRGGGLGFLPAGYRPVEGLAADIAEVRAGAGGPFGVNVFVPGPDTADPGEVAAYVASLRPDADRLGTEPGDPVWSDDGWEAKLALLRRDPVPLVTFTFGCPPAETIAGLRAAGSLVGVTVTTPDEARIAQEVGANLLCVQGPEAGGHQGSFTDDAERTVPLFDLLAEVGRVTSLPMIAAGGLMTATDVARALGAGAAAAQCGTAFLRTPESKAKPAHKAVLADPSYAATTVTRAFSGRRARGQVNAFIRAHDAAAPAAYPQIHYATAPLRTAAAKQDDQETLNLWAGTAHLAAEQLSTAEILRRLTPRSRGPNRAVRR